ncbi:MAG: hypothetical protein FWF88_01575 [Peptococcaceae bacterium]|nr:hypothetical protein [Peptococcaceae bacterium]
MEYALLLSLATIIVALVAVSSSRRANKKLLVFLTSSFGQAPPEAEFELDSVQMYSHYNRDLAGSHERRVDQITWSDLEMDKVFGRINVCLSSIGEEYLYNCLHELPLTPADLEKREGLLEHLETHPEDRLLMQTALAKLGKENYNGLASFIFNKDKKHLPAAPFVYKILAAIPVLSAFLLIFNLTAGVLCLVGSFIINLILHYGAKGRIESALPAIRYFSSLLFCCQKLGRLEGLKPFPQWQAVHENYQVLKPLAGIAAGASAPGNLNEMSFLAEYVRILFLSEIRNYNKIVQKAMDCQREFHNLYRAVGEIDLTQCLLSFRKSLPHYAVPEFHEDNTMAFTDVYHLLLSSPVTNTGVINNDSVITGSNASGKSTFIKALAINGILAQTLNTCTARSFATRFSLVATSMALRDSLQDGDSYFVIEIKSLKRILDFMGHGPCTCYIDEILRGTNTIERIAASASVLAYVHRQDCLCLVASHDIELTDILADTFDNYHFSEQITDDGIRFDYRLKPGPSATRNAIKLLSHMDYDKDIIDQAEKLIVHYEESRTWKTI